MQVKIEVSRIWVCFLKWERESAKERQFELVCERAQFLVHCTHVSNELNTRRAVNKKKQAMKRSDSFVFPSHA